MHLKSSDLSASCILSVVEQKCGIGSEPVGLHFSGGFRHIAVDHSREESLTSALFHGFVQLSTQPQPIGGEWPWEDVTHVEAHPLSQQQHRVVASLKTGEGSDFAALLGARIKSDFRCFPPSMLPIDYQRLGGVGRPPGGNQHRGWRCSWYDHPGHLWGVSSQEEEVAAEGLAQGDKSSVQPIVPLIQMFNHWTDVSAPQRYFVLEAGILRYSKNQQDVSQHYFIRVFYPSEVKTLKPTIIHLRSPEEESRALWISALR